MHIVFPVVIMGLLILVAFGIAGSKKIPIEGIDYWKIIRPDGGVLYEIKGELTYDKPKALSFLERFDQGMNRLALGE